MLTLEKITKSFDKKTVLSRFTASFPAGITAITGESGAGKTTLLRIIAGLEKPDSGTVSGSGKISMVFQEPRLLPWYTAGENIAIVSDSEKARRLLALLGLEGEYDTLPASLSGGMQKRVSLARALSVSYDTLLLDEPFSGLDSANAAAALSVIRKECAEKTVLLVTHDAALAESLDGISRVGS